jgi:hypothetical protein
MAQKSFFFHRLGGVWSPALSYKWRRTLLQGQVHNAIINGLEPFVLHQSDYARLDRRISSLCRTAMRGKAAREREGGAARSLSNLQVMKFGRFVGSTTDVIVRRLKLYQSWAARPSWHAQALRAMFGALVIEERLMIEPRLQDGVPTASASPLAPAVTLSAKRTVRR